MFASTGCLDTHMGISAISPGHSRKNARASRCTPLFLDKGTACSLLHAFPDKAQNMMKMQCSYVSLYDGFCIAICWLEMRVPRTLEHDDLEESDYL